MPKGRKGRKHRHRCLKKKVDSQAPFTQSQLSEDILQTSADPMNNEYELAAHEYATPRPNIITGRKDCNNESSLNTTPVNRNRSNRMPNYLSMNVTNLGVLFDSRISNSPKSVVNISVGDNETPFRKRSHSSIPKLHSPGKERPLRIHKATQTNLDTESVIKKCNEIMETPRVSKVFLMQNSPKSFPMINNKLKNDSGRIKIHNVANEININPYLNKINSVKRDNSCDLSFFPPNLFQHKLSSTPLDQIQKAGDTIENVLDCTLNAAKLDSFTSPLTPKFETNINLNNAITEKVINKEGSIRSLRMHISRRKSYKTSPKSVITSGRNSRNQQFSCSRIRRSTLFEVSTNHENVFARLKRVSQSWSNRVINLCTHLGIQLKNSLSSMCRCEANGQDISKIFQEVRNINCEVAELKDNKEHNGQILNELKLMKEEFQSVKEELQSMKEQLNTLSTALPPLTSQRSQAPSVALPPPVPPPPPPPPPPLPPLLPTSTPSFPTKLNIAKKSKHSDAKKEQARPLITRDDILNIKLRKIPDRKTHTPLTHRPGQSEMPKQLVKLRPASRGSNRSETAESTGSDLTVSPHSSLCRLLLKHDHTSPRLKRLRKIGGYSYDSVYRRNALAKRDREIP